MRCKIQDCWNPNVFEVVEALDTGGRVYRIRPWQDEGPSYNIHRSELKTLPQTPTTSVPPEMEVPQPSVRVQEDDTSLDESSLIVHWVSIPTCTDPQNNLKLWKPNTGPEHLPAPEQLVPLELTSSECPHAQAESSPATSPLTAPTPELRLRRSTRPTAGHHPNPFNLPQSTSSHASEQSIPEHSRPHTEI